MNIGNSYDADTVKRIQMVEDYVKENFNQLKKLNENYSELQNEVKTITNEITHRDNRDLSSYFHNTSLNNNHNNRGTDYIPEKDFGQQSPESN